MADRKLTLFELHFDGGFQFGPGTVSLGRDDETETEDGAETDDADVDVDVDADTDDEVVEVDLESEDEGGNPGAVLLGLLGLVVVAAVVRRLLGGDEDELEIETPDEPESGDVEEFESAE